MASTQELIAAIQQNIRTNDNKEITGQVLQDVLISIVNNIDSSISAITDLVNRGYSYYGILTPEAYPDMLPTSKVFAFACEPGDYSNIGENLFVNYGEIGIFIFNENAWSKQTLDISAYINTYNLCNTNVSYTLNEAIDLVPANLQKGGINLQFTDKNGTVKRYSLMSRFWNTEPKSWKCNDDIINSIENKISEYTSYDIQPISSRTGYYIANSGQAIAASGFTVKAYDVSNIEKAKVIRVIQSGHPRATKASAWALYSVSDINSIESTNCIAKMSFEEITAQNNEAEFYTNGALLLAVCEFDVNIQDFTAYNQVVSSKFENLNSEIYILKEAALLKSYTVLPVMSSRTGYITNSGQVAATSGFTVKAYDVSNIEKVKVIRVIQSGHSSASKASAWALYSVSDINSIESTNCIAKMSFEEITAQNNEAEFYTNGALLLAVCEFDVNIQDFTAYETNFSTASKADELQNDIDELQNDIDEINSSAKKIFCWGDSITAGTVSSPYPSELKNILGNNYSVENLGCGSAWIQDICARQGGVPALLKNDLDIPSDISDISFPSNGFKNKYQEDGFQVAPKYNQTNAVKAYNPIIIDGEKFNIILSVVNNHTVVTLRRVTAGIAFTIKAGTPVIPASIGKYRNGFCIFFMGTNNTANYNFNLPTYTQTIINYHRDCIDLLGHSNYLIIGLFNNSQRIFNRNNAESISPTDLEIKAQYETYESSMEREFGTHFIPMRKLLSSQKGISDAVKAGYMTEQQRIDNAELDAEWIAKGCAAYSFMNYAGGTDYTHPNQRGYNMIAYYVAQWFKQYINY